MKPWQSTIDQVCNYFRTDPKHGLSANEVKKRIDFYGYNEIPEGQQETIISIFINQFKSPLIYVLLFAAVLIFIVGEDKLDAFIISGVLFFNAILGTVQEGRTHNIIESLKRLIKTDSVVLRNSNKEVVQDSQLVPGDIIFLQEGQRVPADARILESNSLQLDESVLTGESHAVFKSVDRISQITSLADQKNMVFRGTYILAGSGKAIVVATARNTEVGAIEKSMSEIKTDIPLRKEIDQLSYWILIFILVICTGLFILGIFTGKPVRELFVMITALFICVIPEGLPVVLTLILVTGVKKMAKQSVLVKNMQAVEALGRTNVIIIDKTGTLTRNEMIVSNIFVDDIEINVTGKGYHSHGKFFDNGAEIKIDNSSKLYQAGIIAELLNTTEITYDSKLDLFNIKGDPTQAALFVFSQKLNLNKDLLHKNYTKVYEIPFSSELRYHVRFFQNNSRYYAFIAGSPEEILKRVIDKKEKFNLKLNSFLDKGLRTIVIAQKEISAQEMLAAKEANNQIAFTKLIETGLEFIALFGIEDAIRNEVVDIIKQARAAGLKIVMATGDHEKTAIHVATKVGIYTQNDKVSDGLAVDTLSDDELAKKIDSITVFSRVSPANKVKIVRAFHKQHKIVAMTGDGINDAPSLIAADLGIAMGSIGTEVAKQASDLILLNDSFANIIRAIELGRHIFYTLKRVVLYFFATNMGEILVVLFAFVASLITGKNIPLPITAAQILWLNLVTDGFLDVGLSMEPEENHLHDKFWLEKKPKLIDRALIAKVFYMAIPMAIGSLWIFFQYYQTDIQLARTITLITLAMYQWFNAWNCRSMTKTIWNIGFFSNKWLLIAIVIVLVLQFAILHISFLQHIFDTVPLSIKDWKLVFTVTIPMVFIDELRKCCFRNISRLTKVGK